MTTFDSPGRKPPSLGSPPPNGSCASTSPPATGWSRIYGMSDMISPTSRRACRASRAFPDQPLRHAVRGDHGLGLIKVDLDGKVIANPTRRLRHQPGRLRHPQRDPRGARTMSTACIHTHTVAGMAVGGEERRPAAAHPERDALRQDRLSRLRGRGGRRRRAARGWCATSATQVMILRNHGLLAVGTIDPARVLEHVQSAVRLRNAGAGDGGQHRAQHPAAGGIRTHRQARRRAPMRRSAPNGPGSLRMIERRDPTFRT